MENSKSNVVQINSKVLSVEVNAKPEAADIQHLHEKVKRPEVLTGSSYRLKTPLSDHALYITINDIVLNEGTEHEQRQPFEIFLNSKGADSHQWIVALTRLISAIFRKGGDVKFIIEELKSVFDPKGGYITKDGYVPSLVAEIGGVVEQHFKSIGLIKVVVDKNVQAFIEEKKEQHLSKGGSMDNASICPICNAKALVLMDGCLTCLECGGSKCG